MDRRVRDLIESAESGNGSRLTRRALLRALGLGGAVVATGVMAGGVTPCTRRAAAQEESPVDSEIEELAFALDLDVESIFRFVADEVRYDAYSGVLRGAKGTLWGLAGNSADQALLLADLLRAALVDVRFVTGELSEESAGVLLDSLSLDAAAVEAHGNRVFGPGVRAAEGDEPPSLTPEQEEEAKAVLARIEPIRDAARAQLADGVATITRALEEAAIALPEAKPALPDREQTQHVWVQYRAGTEWIDLDPSLPDAEVGAAYASPMATLEILPEELHHQLVIRSAIEVVAGGKPSRQEILSHLVRSQDLVGQPVSFFNAAPEALAAFGFTVTGMLEGTTQYVPYLLVGNETITGSRNVTFLTGEGATDLIGGTSDSNEGDTLAQWLEIDVKSPDAPPKTIVREIFDRVGVDQRVTGEFDATTISPVELVDLGEDEGPAYPPALALWSLAVAGGPVPWQQFTREQDSGNLFPFFSLNGQAVHYLRETLAVDRVAELGHRSFLNAPNIAAFVAGPVGVAAEGVTYAVSFDHLHRSWQTVGVTGAEPAADPRIETGVLSHVAERIALGHGWMGGNDRSSGSRGVGRLFEEAVRQGVGVRVFKPGDSGVDELVVSLRAKRRIDEALIAGNAVIVPERAVTMDGEELSGWWKVDLQTSLTLDELETGAGTEGEEELVNLSTVQRIGRYFSKVGCVVQFMYIMAAVEIAVGIPAFMADEKSLAAGMGASAGMTSAAANALKQVDGGGKC